jgi:WD40 repeat protein
LACGQEDGQIRILDTEACLVTTPFVVASDKEEEKEEEQKDKALVVVLSVNDVLNRSVVGVSFSYDGRSLLAAYRATSTTPPIGTSPRIVPSTSTTVSSKGPTVGNNDTIYQWDVSSGKKLGSYYNESGNDDVTAIQISPDGKQFVSCYASGSMSLWNYFKVPPTYKEPPRHLSPVRFVSWIPLMFCKDSKRWTVPDCDKRTDTHDVRTIHVYLVVYLVELFVNVSHYLVSGDRIRG